MRSGKNFFTLLFNLISFHTGCASTGSYNDVGIGVLFNVQTESGGLGVDRGSFKYGESCCYNILGLAVFGDCSIEASKKDGNLKSVSYYDKEIFRVLTLYGSVCTITYGK